MLFNSAIFIVFAALFFLVMYFINRSKQVKLRWVFLVLASFFFYGWWDWRFLFLILGSGFIDYFSAFAIKRFPDRKKVFLIFSLLGNIGSLAIFKYSGFIAENIDNIFRILHINIHLYENIPEFMLLLPVGISFYTFQSMSYTIDVYKGKLEPTKDIFHFFAYLSLFPQLVAGPIVRARDLMPQLAKFRYVGEVERWNGLKIIAIGFFKKVVLADNIGPMVNMAFSNVHQTESTIFWWLAMLGFGFQIYFDFSGYSDIARGLAKWMGLHFRTNFNHPYHSASLREFWTRWHISLSTWFRDYVYIPLGGSRKGRFNSHLFMWITMLVSGLWHGASWNFVIWGGIHALFTTLERLTKWSRYSDRNWLTHISAVLFTNAVVLIAWVFFRADTLDSALYVLQKMFSFGSGGEFITNPTITVGMFVMGISVLIEVVLKIHHNPLKLLPKEWRWYVELVYVAALITLSILFRGAGNEFIYFQFYEVKRERIIYAFILVFIALGAVYFSRDESDMMGNERKHFWVVKTHSDTKSDVVFAGDSRVYRGISPDDFEKGCPSKEALNLGYISNGFHPDYLNFLEQRLKSSDEQSVVVCGITPFAFSRKGSLSSHYWNEKYQTKKEEVIVNMHLYHLSRMIIPYDLKIMLGGNRVKRKDIPYQEFFHLNGWMESTWIHPDSTSALKSYQSTFTDNMFDEEGAKIFFRQVQEWTEKGITVVGMRMPTSFAMKALEDSLSGFDEVRFRNTFTENGGQWLDFDFSEYTSYDGSHLDNESARRFSFELGQKVQDILKEE